MNGSGLMATQNETCLCCSHVPHVNARVATCSRQEAASRVPSHVQYAVRVMKALICLSGFRIQNKHHCALIAGNGEHSTLRMESQPPGQRERGKRSHFASRVQIVKDHRTFELRNHHATTIWS